MRVVPKLLFRVETLDERIFFLLAECMHDALFRAEIFVDKHYDDDLVESVAIEHGEFLELEEGEGKVLVEDSPKKLAAVVGKIDRKRSAGADDEKEPA